MDETGLHRNYDHKIQSIQEMKHRKILKNQDNQSIEDSLSANSPDNHESTIYQFGLQNKNSLSMIQRSQEIQKTQTMVERNLPNYEKSDNEEDQEQIIQVEVTKVPNSAKNKRRQPVDSFVNFLQGSDCQLNEVEVKVEVVEAEEQAVVQYEESKKESSQLGEHYSKRESRNNLFGSHQQEQSRPSETQKQSVLTSAFKESFASSGNRSNRSNSSTRYANKFNQKRPQKIQLPTKESIEFLMKKQLKNQMDSLYLKTKAESPTRSFKGQKRLDQQLKQVKQWTYTPHQKIVKTDQQRIKESYGRSLSRERIQELDNHMQQLLLEEKQYKKKQQQKRGIEVKQINLLDQNGQGQYH